MVKTTYRKPTEISAVSSLKRLFPAGTADALTPEEMYTAAERDTSPGKEAQNRSWLSNKLTALYYYDLAKPVYEYKSGTLGGGKVLAKVQLTVKGKRALGRASEPEINGEDGGKERNHNDRTKPTELTLDDILAAVEALRARYQAFDIVFTIKPKDKPMD
jgi:hypothetical protein